MDYANITVNNNIFFYMLNDIKQYDIALIDLPAYNDERDEHIQTGVRPCVVISNNMCNAHSPNITIVPITSQSKKVIPTHVYINKKITEKLGISDNGLYKDSIILAEGITCVSKKRIIKKMGVIKNQILINAIDRAIDVQLGRVEKCKTALS